MEARSRANSMKRSASMGRAASRSAARGKAKARGRARRGGDDIEMGLKEQKRQDAEERQRSELSFAEEGRSPSPPNIQGDPDSRVDLMEKGKAFKKGFDPDADEMVGGKRRRSIRRKSKQRGGELEDPSQLQAGDYVKLGNFGTCNKVVEIIDSDGYGAPQVVAEKNDGSRIKGNLNQFSKCLLKGGKRRRSKKFYKGKASKSRKGRKDFITHKGDKYFHRKGHRQTKRQGKNKGLFEQLFGL